MQFGLFGARSDGAIEVPIARPDGQLGPRMLLRPRWLTVERLVAAGYRSFQDLHEALDGLPVAQHTIQTKGGPVQAPRLELFLGPGGRSYGYNGEDYPAHPMPAGIAAIMRSVSEAMGEPGWFNAAFLNVYRGGEDSIGWHADDEPALGEPGEVVIASLSLGVARPFQIRAAGRADDRDPTPITTVDLGPGDLLFMPAGCQRGYLHCVPKRAGVRGRRINLTFRRLV